MRHVTPLLFLLLTTLLIIPIATPSKAESIWTVTLYFYDASNNTALNQVNVTVDNENRGVLNSGDTLQLVEGNHTFRFSKEGYEDRTLSIEVSSNTTISVYLMPNSTEGNSTLTPPSEAPPTPNQPLFNYTDDHGFFGFHLGEKLMRLQIGEVITGFFGLTPIFALFIPLITTLGIGVASWYYTRSPPVVLGVLAIMNTFFFLLGLKVRLSMIGPLTALVIFLVAWVFWDLYKSKERT